MHHDDSETTTATPGMTRATAAHLETMRATVTGADPTAQRAMDRSVDAHHALAAMPGVTFEADERVVDDGDVMTAAGVTAGMDLAITLAARLRGEGCARFLELGAEHDPRPPFDVGTPGKAGEELTSLSRDLLAPLEGQLRAPAR